MELGEIIKRKRGTMSLAKFGVSLGLDPNTARQLVWQWEKGMCKPSPEMMKKLGIEVRYEVKK